MKRLAICLTFAGSLLAGCSTSSVTESTSSSDTATADSTSTESAVDGWTERKDAEVDPFAEQAESAAAPVPSELVSLTPENTTIQFVGTHTGDKPDPRTGTFGELSGIAEVNGETLKSVSVDITTSSLTTDIDKLTDHLKSPDFFDVRQYPTATFESTSIESTGDGECSITGNLTLLGQTHPITFPAKISTADGFSLESTFEFDRTLFGMDFGVDKIEKQVAMTITVGK